jgi:mediator of RNA polymerase II transcription subunit 16
MVADRHADNRFLIATHSTSNKLCLYRVGIKWNPLPETKQAPQQFPIPSFQISHTKIEEPPNTFPHSENELDMLEDSTKDLHHFHLTQLEIIESNGEYHKETGPVVIGVFVSTLNTESSLPRGASTVVARWELTSGPLDLHSSFDEVSAKKSNATANVSFL